MSERNGVAELTNSRKRTGIYFYSAVVGIVSGAIIVAYRMAITALEDGRAALVPFFTSSIFHVVLWICIAAAFGLVTAMMVRRSPLIKGSGIPQVKAFLMRRIQFDWRRELPFKFFGGSLALGAGLSLGREGHSLHLGAMTGAAVTELCGRHEYQRYLVTAGAAAGISAAFNAPLAGVLFCIEELHRNISPIMLTSSLIASFCANAVMWAFFGNTPVFGITLTSVLPLNLYFTAVLAIGVASGIAGSLFNRGVLWFQSLYRRIVPNGTLRIVSAFAVATLVAITFSAITGGGHTLVSTLVTTKYSLGMIAALLAGKLFFTLFSYASGAPGGIFLPLLGIGALLGALLEFLFLEIGIPGEYLNNYILVGMVGFFTAVVRAPITGAVLITEMVGSFAHFPAFIFVSVIASLVSGIFRTKPIYDSLLAQIAPDKHDSSHPAPVMLYIPVFEGSVLDTCSAILDALPEGCILTSIERGDAELFPAEGIDIHPGDVLKIVVERGKAHRLKEALLVLGQASPDGIERE